MAPRKDTSGNARFSAPRTLRLLRQQRHRDTSSRRTRLVSGAHPVPCAKLTLGSRDTAAGAHGRRTGTCRSSPWGDAVQCSFLFSSCSGVAAFPTPRRWERIISCCGGSSDSKLCVCSNNRRQMPTLWARQKLHLWLASLSKVNSFSRHRFRAQALRSGRDSPQKARGGRMVGDELRVGLGDLALHHATCIRSAPIETQPLVTGAAPGSRASTRTQPSRRQTRRD